MSRLAAALVRSFRLSRAYCSPVHVGLSAICFLRTAAREPGLERPAGTGRWQPGRGGASFLRTAWPWGTLWSLAFTLSSVS